MEAVMFVIKKWMIYTGLFVIMYLTSPDMSAHENKIQEIFTNSGSNTEVVQVSLTQSNTNLTYHDILVFTYTKHNRRVLTFGALGMVFNVGG
jgi:hypothetical protein